MPPTSTANCVWGGKSEKQCRDAAVFGVVTWLGVTTMAHMSMWNTGMFDRNTFADLSDATRAQAYIGKLDEDIQQYLLQKNVKPWECLRSLQKRREVLIGVRGEWWTAFASANRSSFPSSSSPSRRLRRTAPPAAAAGSARRRANCRLRPTQ